jgi:hypothetical protein
MLMMDYRSDCSLSRESPKYNLARLSGGLGRIDILRPFIKTEAGFISMPVYFYARTSCPNDINIDI